MKKSIPSVLSVPSEKSVVKKFPGPLSRIWRISRLKLPLRSGFRDHKSRSDRPSWGLIIVAALGRQFRVVRGSTLLALSAVCLLVCGCQVLTYSSPTGERFTRSSFGANTSIQSLSVEAGTNGMRRVQLRGYQNDSTTALGAITDAAVKAAIQSVKP